MYSVSTIAIPVLYMGMSSQKIRELPEVTQSFLLSVPLYFPQSSDSHCLTFYRPADPEFQSSAQV